MDGNQIRSAKFKLSAGAMLLAVSQAASAITINLDYSYDTNNFFADSSRKDIMSTAASFFESRLTDSLSAITSSGQNSMTADFYNPSGSGSIEINNFSVAADTITVFVGAQNHGGSTLATGGYGGWSASGTSAFFDTIYSRGQAGSMYNDSPTAGTVATEMNPWGGTISFDTDSAWYFDSDPSTDESFSGSDFFSVALHELGHILGLGSSDSWDNLIIGGEFTGANAAAENSGNVLLTSDGAHWNDGTMSFVDSVAQEAAMDPTLTTGTRKRFTDLDMAALDDIGWDVAAATTVPLPPALLLFAGGLLGMFGLGKRQRSA